MDQTIKFDLQQIMSEGLSGIQLQDPGSETKSRLRGQEDT